jgi:hypothetical protein
MKRNSGKAKTKVPFGLPSPAKLLQPEQVWCVLTARQQETIFRELTHLCQTLLNLQCAETKAVSDEP